MKERQHQLNMKGHDGTFLIGGNELITAFQCDDAFFQHGVANYGSDDIDYLLSELAEDISGAMYQHLEETYEEAEAAGKDTQKAWENLHDEKGIFWLTDPDDYWDVAVNSFWGMCDTLALTTGQAIMPHLREEVEAYIARTA